MSRDKYKHLSHSILFIVIRFYATNQGN